MSGETAIGLMDTAMVCFGERTPFVKKLSLAQIPACERHKCIAQLLIDIGKSVSIAQVHDDHPAKAAAERQLIQTFKAWVPLMTEADWDAWYWKGLSSSRMHELFVQVDPGPLAVQVKSQ